MNQLAMDQSDIAEILSLTTQQPSKPIADVERIGKVDAGVDNLDLIKGESSDTLSDKLDEYRAEGDNLTQHHDYMLDRFNTLFDDYVSMFSTLDVLSALSQSIQAVLPDFQLQEEFSFFSLDGDNAELAATLSQVILWGSVGTGALAAGVGVYTSYAGWKASKVKFTRHSAKMITNYRGQVIPKQRWDKLSKLGKARVLKALGVVGAVAGVVGAGFGIYATIQNEIARRDFLESSVFNFQNWYDETRDSYDALAGGVEVMENDLRQMMGLLGVADVDDPGAITDDNLEALKARLNDASVETGKHASKVKTAARIFCRDSQASAGTVANLTGLKLLRAADIQAQIQGTEGTKICALVED